MRKNKWKTEKGYFTIPKSGKTFKQISEILSEDEGVYVPQSTVNNIFRNSMIKIVNHIAEEFDKKKRFSTGVILSFCPKWWTSYEEKILFHSTIPTCGRYM